MRFTERMYKFLYGRYGYDALSFALLGVYFVLAIINLFIHSIIIEFVKLFIFIITLLRAFSRNIYKRQNENLFFLKYWNKIKKPLAMTGKRLKDIKTHRYRKCSHCKATLRLPRKSGKHTVRCPRCGRKFDVRIIL